MMTFALVMITSALVAFAVGAFVLIYWATKTAEEGEE